MTNGQGPAGGLRTPCLIILALLPWLVTAANLTPTITVSSSWKAAENGNTFSQTGTISGNPGSGESTQTLTWAITAGNVGTPFAISSTGLGTTATLSIIGSLNYESRSSYSLTIQATDDGSPPASATSTVSVSVTNVNEAPVVTPMTFSIAENVATGTSVGSVVAADPENCNCETYSITAGNTANKFSLCGCSSISTAGSLDYETTNQYLLTISVSDGSLTGTAVYTINILDVNEAPTLAAASFSIAESAALGSVVGTIVGSDVDAGTTLTYSIISGNSANKFALASSTGQLTVNGVLDHETTPSYSLSIRVSDGALSTSRAYTVTVTNVNEPPVMSGGSFSVAENTALTTLVGTIVGTDPEGSTVSYSITAGNTGGAFALGSSNGRLTVASALDFETISSYSLTVQASDGVLTSSATYTVTITNVNESPTITGATWSVPENAGLNTVVGTVAASDPDVGTTLTYSIVNVISNNPFSLAGNQLLVTQPDSALMNFELNTAVSLTIRASDGALSATASFTVLITNVNEAPIAACTGASPVWNVFENATLVGALAATDPELDVLSYTITGGNIGSVFAFTGSTIVVASTLDFEAGVRSFLITARISDGALFVSCNVTINVANAAPSITAGSWSIAETAPIGMVVGAVAATDPGGTELSYLITAGNALGLFAVAGNQLIVASGLDFETTPAYMLTIQASDGLLSSAAPFTISVVNVAPSMQGASWEVPEDVSIGATVGTLVGTDAGGTPVSYSITLGNAAGDFAVVGNQVQLVGVLDFESTPRYFLTVRASDGLLSSTALVTINVTNVAPTIAGASWNIAENAPVSHAVGTIVASDAGGTPLTFSITSGNSAGQFSMVANQLQVAAPLDYETTAAYNLTVQVSDGSLVSTAIFGISVMDANDAPVLAPQSWAVPENAEAGTLVGSVVASDQDIPAQSLVWSIVDGNVNAAFAINATTGQLFVRAPAVLDYETNSAYSLSIRVQDSGSPVQTTTTTCTVVVTDVNDAPVLPPQTWTIAESISSSTVVGTASATDADLPAQTLTWTLVSGNEQSQFSLDELTGQVTVAAQLNFERTPSYELVLKVQDNGIPSLSATTTFVILIHDVNDPPIMVGQAWSVPENSNAGALVGWAMASDEDANPTQSLSWSIVAGNLHNAFTVNALTGQVSVTASTSLDFEARSSYSLTVRVQDNGTPALWATAVFNVTVLDVNDAPVMVDQTFTINENSEVGAVVGSVVATDADVPTQALAWSLVGGNVGGAFSISSASGVITVGGPLNFEALNLYTLQVQVQDDGVGRLSVIRAVTVRVMDVNDAPQMLAQEWSVPENSMSGTSVGVASATDEDAAPAQTLTWSIIGGNVGTAFRIHAATGAVTVDGLLNAESRNTYSLVVQVQDSGVSALSATALFVIHVIDVNDAPVLHAQSRSIPEIAAVGTVVTGGAIAASDEDLPAQVLHYHITAGNADDAFAIHDTTGVISVARQLLDYEARNVYYLVVNVSDAGREPVLWTTGTVTIALLDVNDAPVLNDTVRHVTENSPVGTTMQDGPLQGGDQDRPTQALTYTIESGNVDGIFTLHGATGVLSIAKAVLNYEVQAAYELIIRVTDSGAPPLSSTGKVTVQLLDTNDAPVIGATTRYINENSAVGTQLLQPVVAWDEDQAPAQAVTFSIIAGNSGAAFDIHPVTGIIFVKLAKLNFESVNMYNLTVQVTDDGVPSLQSSALVTVLLKDVNELPALNATARNIDENAVVGAVVNGGPIRGGDVDSWQLLSYRISAGNVDEAFTIDPSSGVLSVATAVLNFEVRPSYELTINVTDNGTPMLWTANLVTVYINDINEKPSVKDACSSVPENSEVGMIVSGGNIVAVDEDRPSQSLTYSLVSGDVDHAFALNARTGQLSVAASVLNYELRQEYHLLINVTDDGVPPQWQSVVRRVSVDDVNDQPIFNATSLMTRSVHENAVVGTLIGPPVLASDEDAGQTLRFCVAHVSGDAAALGMFGIDETSGQIFVAANRFNFERMSSYQLTVNVTDDGSPPLHNVATIWVHLLDVNDAPVLVMPAGLASVNENSAVGTSVDGGQVLALDDEAAQVHTFTIIAGSDGMFAIDRHGVITVASPLLDFETRSAYNLTIRVTDNGAPPLHAEVFVPIVLLDVNEVPVATNHEFQLPENSAVGTLLLPALSALVEDQDANSVLHYRLARGDPDGRFGLDVATGHLSVRRAVFDYEMLSRFELVINVTDSGEPPLWVTFNVIVNVSNVNEMPFIAAATRFIEENSPVGADLPPALNATDLDTRTFLPFGQLTYTLDAGNEEQVFEIDAATGLLTVRTANMDYERRQQYILTVSVTDPVGLRSSASVTVNIMDVNEAPTIGAASRQIEENADVGAVVGEPIAAVDIDAGQRLAFSIEAGDVDQLFLIDPQTGQLSIAQAAVNYEQRNLYTLLIRVTDDGTFHRPLHAEANVSVSIIDVNEVPVILPAHRAVQEQQRVGTLVGSPVVAWDPDVRDPWNVTSFEIVDGNYNSFFSIDEVGQIRVNSMMIDYEAMPIHYNLSVRVVDHGQPPLGAVAVYSIHIVDVNDAPDINDTQRMVPENSPVGTAVGASLSFYDQDMTADQFTIVHDTSGGLFSIDANTGQLYVAAAYLDFEQEPEFEVEIQITDPGTPPLSDVARVRILLLDVNDVPVVAPGVYAVNEDAEAGTSLGFVHASDQDAGVRGDLSFNLTGGNTFGLFAVNATTGELTVAAAQLDFETSREHVLTVTVYDHAIPPAQSSANMTVHVLDRNDAPFASDSVLYIDEFPEEGGVVMMKQTTRPVVMWDVDTPAYPQRLAIVSSVMVEPDADEPCGFSVNATGHVALVNGSLNFERKQAYVVRVVVQDGSSPMHPGVALQPANQQRVVDVPIAVRDVNEKAQLTAPSQVTADEGSKAGTILLSVDSQFIIHDPDNQTLNLVVIGDDFFRFDNATSVRNADGSRAPRYLMINKPGLPNGVRVVQVQAQDPSVPSKSSAIASVVIQVADKNDQPVVQGFRGVDGLSSTSPSQDTLLVPEGTTAGTKIGDVLLYDRDLRQLHTCTVDSSYSSYFGLVVTPPPAELQKTYGPYNAVRSVSLVLLRDFLDYETLSTHSFAVCAKDDGRVLGNVVNGVQQYRVEAPLEGCVTLTVNVTDTPDAPVISDVLIPSEASGLATPGGEVVTLRGHNFGPKLAPGPTAVMFVSAEYTNGNVSFTAVDCSVVEAYSAITCKSVPGFGHSFHWRVLLGNAGRRQVSNWFTQKLTSYARPNVIAFDPPNNHTSTTGLVPVVIIGSQFGTVQHGGLNSVTYGRKGSEYAALNCRLIEDHVRIQCLLAPGVGAGLQWTVEVGHQHSATATTSYAAPVLAEIRSTQLGNFSTAGADAFVLHGSNFGTRSENAIDSVLYGPPSAPRSAWLSAANCRVVVDHTEIHCLTAEGAGIGHAMVVKIASQESAVSDFQFNYAAPVIERIQLAAPAQGAPTRGDTRVIIQGRNLGSKSAARAVRFGSLALDPASVVYVSHTALHFTLPPGAGVDKKVVVDVEGQQSNAALFRYDGPMITGMKHVAGAAGQDITVAILGSNFGYCCYQARSGVSTTCECAANATLSATVGGTVCALVRFVSDSEYHCKTRATTGGVQFSVGGLVSEAFLYDFKGFLSIPFISTVQCGGPAAGLCGGSNAPVTAGGTLVTVYGGSFATEGMIYFFNGGVMQKLRTVTTSYSDSQLQFVIPPGQGLIAFQVAVMGETKVSANFSLAYRAPVITQITPLTGPTAGGALVTIRGSDFGLNDTSGLVRVAHVEQPGAYDSVTNAVYIGGRVCAIRLYTHSLIVCEAPAGAGTQKAIELRVGRLGSEAAAFLVATVAKLPSGMQPTWAYAGPVVDSIAPAHGPTLGGTRIVLTGANLGGSFGSLSLDVGGAIVSDVVSRSHDEIVFKTRPGVGARLPVSLVVDGQRALFKPLFSYDPPEVHSVVADADEKAQLLPSCWQQPVCLNTTFNALAATLVLRGRNFGPFVPPAQTTTVMVGNARCLPVAGAPTVWMSDSMLSCTISNVPVGPKALWVNISQQEVTIAPTRSVSIRAECREDYFGSLPGERCLPCPPAAVCSGRGAEPMALAGYWKFNRTRFEACNPPSACQGGSSQECATGYTGRFCSACVAGKYYRDTLSRECLVCPNQAWLYIAGFVLACTVGGFMVYKIFRARPSLAAITIVLDYLQVLSIVGNLDLKWPESFITLYHWSSAAAFNIDIVSPECSFALTYATKWYALQSVPILSLLVLLAAHVGNCIRKFVAGRRGPLTKHWHKLASWWLLLLNLLYLALLKKALEALACKDIGNERYLVADPSMPCSGSEYNTLRLSAIVSIVVYCIGIPGQLLYLLVKHREGIRVSHALRARGAADVRAQNPYVDVHKLLSILYLRFTPAAYYWPVVILVRKAALTLVAAQVGDDAMLIGLCAAVVLSFSYVGQSKVSPYARLGDVAAEVQSRRDLQVLRHLRLSTMKQWFWSWLKTDYLLDPNMLEAACLECSLGLLLTGLMQARSQQVSLTAPEQVGLRLALEIAMLVLVGWTLARCAVSVVQELRTTTKSMFLSHQLARPHRHVKNPVHQNWTSGSRKVPQPPSHPERKYRFVVSSVVVQDLHGIDAGAKLELQLKLHPSKASVEFGSGCTENLLHAPRRLAAWHRQHDTLHVILIARMGLSSFTLGFGSLPVVGVGESPAEHAVTVVDVTGGVICVMVVTCRTDLTLEAMNSDDSVDDGDLHTSRARHFFSALKQAPTRFKADATAGMLSNPMRTTATTTTAAPAPTPAQSVMLPADAVNSVAMELSFSNPAIPASVRASRVAVLRRQAGETK